MGGAIFVVADISRGKGKKATWDVVKSGRRHEPHGPSKNYRTKEKAVKAAIKEAKRQGTTLVIKGQNGKIQEVRHYG